VHGTHADACRRAVYPENWMQPMDCRRVCFSRGEVRHVTAPGIHGTDRRQPSSSSLQQQNSKPTTAEELSKPIDTIVGGWAWRGASNSLQSKLEAGLRGWSDMACACMVSGEKLQIQQVSQHTKSQRQTAMNEIGSVECMSMWQCQWSYLLYAILYGRRTGGTVGGTACRNCNAVACKPV